jgi:adenosylmethionine-8-amino-7-oxononanoate aminotransferase
MKPRNDDHMLAEWAERDERYLWHPMSGPTTAVSGTSPAAPMTVEKGEGAWVTDAQGNRYLDGMSGLWCVNVGYGREELARAAHDQLAKLPYYPLTASHKPAVELAEKLNEWLDDEYVIYYSNSGSEANEVAFKIARQYHQQNGEPSRWKFISRYRAYHGNSFGAGAATGMGPRKYRYEPLTPGFLHVQPADRYRCAYCSDRPACNLECAREIERTMRWEMPETVAAVIMEPILTGSGVLVPPDGYVEEVAAACRRTGALLIIDEVISGFGRTGKRFGYHHNDIKPDIVTMAKGITSGYMPLSATAVKRDLYETFAGPGNRDGEGAGSYERLRHINTFGGHPAACAVALRNLQIMDDEGLVQRSAEMGETLREKLKGLEGHPNVGQIRNRGLLFGIELVADKASRTPLSTEALTRVAGDCKERGVLVGRSADTTAGFSNTINLAPPLVIAEEDVQFLAQAVTDAINLL